MKKNMNNFKTTKWWSHYKNRQQDVSKKKKSPKFFFRKTYPFQKKKNRNDLIRSLLLNLNDKLNLQTKSIEIKQEIPNKTVNSQNKFEIIDSYSGGKDTESDDESSEIRFDNIKHKSTSNNNINMNNNQNNNHLNTHNIPNPNSHSFSLTKLTVEENEHNQSPYLGKNKMSPFKDKLVYPKPKTLKAQKKIQFLDNNSSDSEEEEEPIQSKHRKSVEPQENLSKLALQMEQIVNITVDTMKKNLQELVKNELKKVENNELKSKDKPKSFQFRSKSTEPYDN